MAYLNHETWNLKYYAQEQESEEKNLSLANRR